MNKPRVLLADDHKMMLAGLHKLLEDNCEIVGTAPDGRALVEAAQRLEPDLIILDIAMPLLNGIDAARQIKTFCPKTKLIFLEVEGETGLILNFLTPHGKWNPLHLQR